MTRFVLASASPARYAALRAAGLDPEVVVSGVDESAITAPDTPSLVVALASAKASAVAASMSGDAVVLGCDSLLELDGAPFGKPVSADEAAARWRRMAGRSAVLYTGHHVLHVVDGTVRGTESAAAATTVQFAAISDRELAAYVASGEPLDVAGAFTIDGLGGWFVDSIDGDHHNVVGVSLPVVRRLLGKLGFSVVDFWRLA